MVIFFVFVSHDVVCALGGLLAENAAPEWDSQSVTRLGGQTECQWDCTHCHERLNAPHSKTTGSINTIVGTSDTVSSIHLPTWCLKIPTPTLVPVTFARHECSMYSVLVRKVR